MSRFEIAAMTASVGITLLLAKDIENAAYWCLSFCPVSKPMLSVAVAGFLIATYGPMALAALFWRRAKHAQAAWLFHLLLLPCAIALFWAGEYLMVVTLDDPGFDHTLGGPIVAACLLFILAIGGYSVALLIRRVFKRRDQIPPVTGS